MSFTGWGPVRLRRLGRLGRYRGLGYGRGVHAGEHALVEGFLISEHGAGFVTRRDGFSGSRLSSRSGFAGTFGLSRGCSGYSGRFGGVSGCLLGLTCEHGSGASRGGCLACGLLIDGRGIVASGDNNIRPIGHVPKRTPR